MTFTIPPSQHVFFSSKFEWSPLWILPNFLGGSKLRLTPPPGINNVRSLMRFAIIMLHDTMAYHVQRAYKGPTIWLLRAGGGGYGWFQKKTSWSLILSTRKILQGNICHTIALSVREKYSITRGSGKKNSYADPLNHPYPAQSQMGLNNPLWVSDLTLSCPPIPLL